MTNIISAEIEFEDNKLDVTYDFTSVVIKYSKTMEKEIYLFMKELFKVLIKNSKDVENIEYAVNGINYKMSDILIHKPNLGTYKFLIKSNIVENAIKESFENNSIFSLLKKHFRIILIFYKILEMKLFMEVLHLKMKQIL